MVPITTHRLKRDLDRERNAHWHDKPYTKKQSATLPPSLIFCQFLQIITSNQYTPLSGPFLCSFDLNSNSITSSIVLLGNYDSLELVKWPTLWRHVFGHLLSEYQLKLNNANINHKKVSLLFFLFCFVKITVPNTPFSTI